MKSLHGLSVQHIVLGSLGASRVSFEMHKLSLQGFSIAQILFSLCKPQSGILNTFCTRRLISWTLLARCFSLSSKAKHPGSHGKSIDDLH